MLYYSRMFESVFFSPLLKKSRGAQIEAESKAPLCSKYFVFRYYFNLQVAANLLEQFCFTGAFEVHTNRLSHQHNGVWTSFY